MYMCRMARERRVRRVVKHAHRLISIVIHFTEQHKAVQ